MLVYTPFTFSRAIYLLSMGCANGKCYKKFEDIPNELITCIILLYVGAIVYFVLGVYFHEVVPQEYGTSQEMLFFLKSCRKKKKTHYRRSLPADQSVKIDELQEDEDTKSERVAVDKIDSEEELTQYPLICKDLRKVYASVEGRKSHVAVKSLTFSIKRGEIFGLLGPVSPRLLLIQPAPR